MSTLSDIRIKSVRDIENEVSTKRYVFIISIIRTHYHFKIARRRFETVLIFFLLLCGTFILNLPLFVAIHVCSLTAIVSLQYNYTFAVEEQAARRICPSVSG